MGTEFFEIVAGVLQGDTLAPYLFIICLDYILRTSLDLMKENSFTLIKQGADRRYPIEIIMDADYTDIAILANTHTQVKSMLHTMELAAGGIGLCVNVDKTGNKEKARRQLHKNATSYIEQILEATYHETAVIRPPTS